MENEIFETSWSYWRCTSKTIKICQNQLASFLRFLFTEDFLKIRGSETTLLVTFFVEIFYKNFFLTLHKLAKFHYQTVYFLRCSVKCVSKVLSFRFKKRRHKKNVSEITFKEIESLKLLHESSLEHLCTICLC